MVFNMQSMALSKHDTVRLLVIYNLTTTPLREHPISPTCGRARHLCCLNPQIYLQNTDQYKFCRDYN